MSETLTKEENQRLWKLTHTLTYLCIPYGRDDFDAELLLPHNPRGYALLTEYRELKGKENGR